MIDRCSVVLDCVGQDLSPVGQAQIQSSCSDKTVKLTREEELTILRAFLRDCNIHAKHLLVNYDPAKKRRGSDRSLFFDPNIRKNKQKTGGKPTPGGENRDASESEAEEGEKDTDRYYVGYFGQVVGTLSGRLEDFTLRRAKGELRLNASISLRIRSRMDRYHAYFVSTLLLDRPGLRLTTSTVPTDEGALFDYLLALIFRDQLREANLKGLFRTYQTISRNDSRPRGALDIARHIRLNLGQDNGRIAYHYRENTVDNAFNRMLVYCYRVLKEKHPEFMADNFDNNADLYALMKRLELQAPLANANLREMLAVSQRAISHPFFTEYELLRQTCAKILRDSGIDQYAHSYGVQTSGILFYMPDLWELFLASKFRSLITKRSENALEFRSQPEIKVYGNGGVIPDYVVHHKTTDPESGAASSVPFSILDAKFKPGWYDVFCRSKNKNLSGALLADFAECVRNGAIIGRFSSGVVFPVEEERVGALPENGYFPRSMVVNPISGENRLTRFFSFPIVIPSDTEDKEYSDWLRALNLSVERAMGEIHSVMKEEWTRSERIRTALEPILQEAGS